MHLRIINERYEILEALSRDSSIAEYLVADNLRGGLIKRVRIFDPEMSNYDFIKVMESQFVDLKTVVHENLLSVYEFQPIMTINGSRINRKQFFYTYEHYDPSKVVDYLDLNKSEINSVLIQLMKVVRFLHFRGIVYKYLNFDQIVLLRDNNQVTLKLREVAGSFVNDYYYKMDHERFGQFIAPEILWGEEIDNTVDIYSFGVVFYYLYYRVDYQLKSLQNILKNTAGGSNDIYNFILRATNHIREERFSDIEEVIMRLSRLIWIDVDKSDVDYYDRIHDKTRVIGRDSVLNDVRKRIHEKYKKTFNEHGTFIEGDPGSGKSRLLKEISYIAKFNRFDYLLFSPSEVPYDSFETIRMLLKRIFTENDISPLLVQKYGQELVTLLPDLKTTWNIKEAAIINPEVQNLRILNRIFNFFLEYTHSHFMVLIMDNVELLNPREYYFYNLLLEYKGTFNYYCVFSGTVFYRDVPADLYTIKMPSLNLEETGQLVKAALGLSYIPYKLTHRLMVETQGKASVTKRMLKKLWSEGYIFFDRKTMSWNLDQIDDNFSFDYIDSKREDFEKLIEDVNPRYIEILKHLSALKGSFSMQTIFDYVQIDEETGYYFLYEMEDKKILNKRISDVEYVFVFHNNELQKFFFDALTPEEQTTLSRQAADYYEKRFIEMDDINESLIDYLIACDDLDRAAAYCVTFADRYVTRANNHKAVELLEQAYDLYRILDSKALLAETGMRLVRQLIRVGRLDKAFERAQTLLEIMKSSQGTAYIDAQIESATILFYKNDIQQAKKVAETCLQRSQTLEYEVGAFSSAHLLCRCLVSMGNLEIHEQLASDYLERAELAKRRKFIAIFQNETGVNRLYKNEFSGALAAFLESLKHYKTLKDEENIVKAYNNLGVVYLDGYGDYATAREYFKKAYTRASNRNILVSVPIYLNNLGETYRIEGRYATANRYFEESHQIAENVGDKSVSLLSLLNLSHGYLLEEMYGKAHTVMNRLEHEVHTIQKRDYDKFDYYLLHFEFYLAMNSIMKVDKWRYEFDADSMVDDFRRYRLRIVDMSLNYKKSSMLGVKKQFAISEIEEMANLTRNPSEAKLLRDFILSLAIDLIEENDFIIAQHLLSIDEKLTLHYDTHAVQIKRTFAVMCLSENAVEHIKDMLGDIKVVSDELLWRAYKVLGNELYYRGELFDALKYNLMSLDVLADLTSTIPAEYKETYILYDDSKAALKNRLNRIVKQLLHSEAGVTIDEHIDTVEDFFDLSQFNLLYENQVFMQLVYAHYGLPREEIYSTTTELVKNLKKDEIYNLELILKYLKQLTIAERALLYLLDENDNISERISADEETKPYDIMRLINNIGNDIDGVFISKFESQTNMQLLGDGQKGIICFPIYETTASDNHGQFEVNRKEDLLIVKKRITGYVFLDTDSVINRFNEEMFIQAKSFINLIYVFIDNYNLKRVSTIDKLTGVYLRKHLEQQFAVQMSVSREQNYNLSVIMLDIDKFKNVNDTYGHRKGDEILSRIGELLIHSVRTTDYVARYGGEEFIILLPETGVSSGYKVAEKIRRIIQDSKLLGEDRPLTVSLGISTYPKDGANEEELIEKADRALYYSKNNGRNQSTSWDDKLLKAGQRYDKLTGILTGNISSDTRNVQALIDIVNQLDHGLDRMERIRNTFISLLDITEGEEIQFIGFDASHKITEVIYKKKGQDALSDQLFLSTRLIEQFRTRNEGHFFIDWEEVQTTSDHVPQWRSYIILAFHDDYQRGLLSISVNIAEKEFDFSNLNFVESLRPVIDHIFFDDHE